MADFPVNFVVTNGQSTTDGLFAVRSPKSDTIKAVKLTAKNLREVAAYVLKALGDGVQVEPEAGTYPGGISLVRNGIPTYLANVGDWLTEKYDYVGNKVYFKKATLDECEKYDLR